MIFVTNLTGLSSRIRNLVAALRLGHLVNDRVKLNFDHEFFFTYDQLSDRELDQVIEYCDWRLDDPESQGNELIRENKIMVVDGGGTVPARGIDFQYTNIKTHVREMWLSYFDLIKWNPDIQQLAQDHYNNLGLQNGIGVHIRSWHDNLYRHRLLHNINLFTDSVSDTGTKLVYLSCDCFEVEQEFKNAVSPDVTVVTQGFDQERHISLDNSIETMVFALVDLFLLAKCSTIIGTYQSSFSDLAWWLSRCQANMIIPIPGYAKKLNSK